MGTLYELKGLYQEIYNMFLDEEIDEETLTATLESLEGEFEDVMECQTKLLRNLYADAKSYKSEKLRFAKKQSQAENAIDRVKAWMSEMMELAGRTKVKTPTANLTLRKTKSVEITDLEKIPVTYIKTTYTPMKTDIKKAIENGEVIEGAEIVEKEGVMVR
ncbi:siphovirus Gp157 family protein [Streptococcus hyovaginalis]|uniref:siphovirus Gp157 family protein n=1 Tax=Streptococcus hyovaginalis TaxID=149015 RepID=UPI0014795EAF|nr:siphovirus Gp157 family protein [Streptococcus hyovaginalis]